MSTAEAPVENDLPLPAKPGPWRWLNIAILGLFLILAYTYVWTVQPGYGPDEPRHLAFVKRLVEKGRLPLLVNNAEEDNAIVLHPPLYYFSMAPVYAATRGLGDKAANRVIKHFSPVILFGSLLLFLSTLRRLFPDRPFAVTSALAVTALLPEFLLEASVMNNDSFAVLFGSLLLWHLVRTWNEPPSARAAMWAGLIMAGFVSSKATGWTLAPLWGLALLLRWRSQPDQPLKLWIRDLLIGYGLLLLLGTWWYVRNYMLYGQAVPLPLEYMGQSMRPYNTRTMEILTPAEVYTSGYVVHWGWRAVEGIFQSYWSQIDWIREEYRPAIWGTMLGLVVLAIPGWLLSSRPLVAFLKAKRAKTEATAPRPTPYWVLAVAFLLPWLSTWFMATFLHIGFYQGARYLMPVAFAASILLAVGWDRWLPARVKLPSALALTVGFLAFNVLCMIELVTVLNPRYVVD